MFNLKRAARTFLAAIAIAATAAVLVAVTAKPAHAQPAATDYEFVNVSATDQVLGPVGGAGDVLQYLVVTVSTAATSTVSIKDGAGSAVALVPANTPVGVYTIIVGARSMTGAWSVTTGAGASAFAVGRFR